MSPAVVGSKTDPPLSPPVESKATTFMSLMYLHVGAMQLWLFRSVVPSLSLS